MFAVVQSSDNKYTGVVYGFLTDSISDHHSGQDEYFIEVDAPPVNLETGFEPPRGRPGQATTPLAPRYEEITDDQYRGAKRTEKAATQATLLADVANVQGVNRVLMKVAVIGIAPTPDEIELQVDLEDYNTWREDGAASNHGYETAIANAPNKTAIDAINMAHAPKPAKFNGTTALERFAQNGHF